MDFRGTGKRITPKDIELIAGYLGCHIAAVNAVLAVESLGRGFAADNRPIILNEPHVLWRELQGAQRTQAVNKALAYQKWGTRPYPRTQNERYSWLADAMKINEVAALRSCSWGLGQVMGFNHKVCGFSNVQDFVRAQLISEGAQLYTMARFIVGNKLQRHLRSRDWRAFARGYNGAGYEKNNYHTKLANAYNGRPASEKRTPPPTSERDLFAMIAVEAAMQPPPSPVGTPEPAAEVLRETQPYQPPEYAEREMPDDTDWTAANTIAAVFFVVVIVIVIALIGS